MKLALVALLCLARLNFSPLAFSIPLTELDCRGESEPELYNDPNYGPRDGGRKDSHRWQLKL